jgi:hypothetical protein
LSQINTTLINLLDKWDNELCATYEKYIDLTYFSGDQFWQIEDYIYNRSSFHHPGYHLLQYIDIDPNLIEISNERQQTPEDRLKNLGHLLSKQRHIASLQEKSLKVKKVLLIETTNEGILRAIISLFSLTSIPPTAHRIFFCTLQTSWIQIRGFVYRCFYSQSFHQLIRPELLSQSIQDQFIYLLRSLNEQKPLHNFRMGIITTMATTNQHLINGIQSMRILNILRDQELLTKEHLQENIGRLIQNCTLVTSRITGLGKSSIICQKIKQSEKNYIKFPIHGDFDGDTLAERLRSKFSEIQTGAIHLDIGFINNTQYLDEILYCLVLFHSFRFGQVAVSIPPNTPIYIELDASPESTLHEMSLIQHLISPIHINDIDWTIRQS